MGKGFFISKRLGFVGILFVVTALCTIIALSVVYSQEKRKNSVSPENPTTTTATTTAATTLDQNLPWNRYRLPKSLIPEHYTVKLRPNLTKDDQGLYLFWGESTVRFLCKEATAVIIIHSNKLNYTKKNDHLVSLKGVNGSQPPEIVHTELVIPTQYLVVHLKNKLTVNHSYEMESTFIGELADDLAGFYRSEYVEDGTNKVVATTQMQAADARKSFPCFDEPAMKATFDITLIYPSDHVAISNMPSISSVTENHMTTTQFKTTPKMSTYLLAYIVSQFKSVEKNETNFQIRIWARPKAIEAGHGHYALNVTGRILTFFENHYNTSYPLPKSDQVGLPDFNAGAMENWGLVTYRENSLLYDELSSSISNKERVVTVIAHELAHQWFGNLVTVAWWNDLWLNEGFASYVEYLGADFAEPSWRLKDLIVQNELYRVMSVDALATSHPLSSPEDEVNTPAEISELFDSITYSKGASVLRMLSSFLTEDLFKTGLASYLHYFSYKNTVYQDLWNHLQQAVNNQSTVHLPTSVQTIMDRWILQMGFPVLTLNTATGVLSQKHFLLDPTSNVTRPSPFNYLWIVPVSAVKSNGENYSSVWLNGTVSDTFDKFKTTSNEWILLNINVTGYYLVNYDEGNWKKLQNQLRTNPSLIPVINRAQIIHDGFFLARANYVPTILALENTLFLEKEVEYLPWDAVLSSLSYFRLMFDRSEVYGPMKAYLKKQATPLFYHFKNITGNWTRRPSTLMEQYNEINAISTACSNGLTECGELASNLFKQWMTNSSNNPIHPNLRSTIYCNAIARGGEEEWNFAWEQFRNATLVTEADKLRSALACSREVWILQRYLSYSLDPTLIRKQDATSTISSICRNSIGQSLTWDFVRSNWKKLFLEYGGGSFSFSRLILSVTQRFSTEFELQELKRFKQDNMDVGFGSGTRALEQALEKTKANIKWVRENKALVLEWFKSHSQ